MPSWPTSCSRWRPRDAFQDQGIGVNALHPGALATNIWNRYHGVPGLFMRALAVFMRNPEIGGNAVLETIRRSEPGEVSGRYFHVTAERRPQPQAENRDLARDLWEMQHDLGRPESMNRLS